eukprot:1161479-Pelagomonas_calceolata.AAC.4
MSAPRCRPQGWRQLHQMRCVQDNAGAFCTSMDSLEQFKNGHQCLRAPASLGIKLLVFKARAPKSRQTPVKATVIVHLNKPHVVVAEQLVSCNPGGKDVLRNRKRGQSQLCYRHCPFGDFTYQGSLRPWQAEGTCKQQGKQRSFHFCQAMLPPLLSRNVPSTAVKQPSCHADLKYAQPVMQVCLKQTYCHADPVSSAVQILGMDTHLSIPWTTIHPFHPKPPSTHSMDTHLTVRGHI